jgi:hypothetical protein
MLTFSSKERNNGIMWVKVGKNGSEGEKGE